ncbi:putative transposase or invertase [Thiovulum sp. ES]|nr:putative transposase or invertase [Thiovulum sp. ES]
MNAILQLKSPIKSIEFGNLEKVGDFQEEKKSIFDIFAIDENGKEIIVELQRANQDFFIDRAVFYTSKQFVDMGIKGRWDYKLKPVYFIGITDFSHFGFDDDYIRFLSLKDKKCKDYFEKMNFVFIELPKFNKKIESEEDYKTVTSIEKWLFFLKNLESLNENKRKVFENSLRDENIEEAFEIAYFSQLKGAERIKYESELKDRRDKFSEIKTAHNEGVQKGIEQGLEQGRKAGILEIAKNLLLANAPLDLIISSTGLSQQEIESI